MQHNYSKIRDRYERLPGATKHPLHRTWRRMIDRCTNKNSDKYYYYGGRGIQVCARWFYSFKNFVDDMGDRPEGHTLDRIDNNGNYTPHNCKWSTHSEQNKNQRPRVCSSKFQHLKDDFILYRSMGFKYREIADEFKCSATTVWKTINAETD